MSDIIARVEWQKFLTTEWIAFVLLVGLGTAGWWKMPDKVAFVEWAGYTAALAVNLGVVRSWQKGQAVKE